MSWTKIGEDIDGEAANDLSGYSVSLSSDGSVVAIGARENDSNGTSSGHVRVYQNDNNVWKPKGSSIVGENNYDQSGHSVSLSSDGSIVAIGAIDNDDSGSNSGHVRVYEYINGNWLQIGEDIDGEGGDDESGYSVSLSSDGSIVAIGAYKNDGNGTTNSGHVRVFEKLVDSVTQEAYWQQIGEDIDGEAANDQSGYSVSLSSDDGSVVAIGAPFNDGKGGSSGHVRVYENKELVPVAVAIADPYIYPMRSSIPVKLPDLEACYRLYQSKDTFINAEVSIATKEHEKRMTEFVEKLGHDTKDVITDGYFFSKFFISDGKNKMVVDLREKLFSLLEGSDKTFFNISQNNNNAGNKDWNGKAKNVVVQWITEEGNKMKATVSFFANPHIENGISLSVNNLPQKALGLCVSNYRPKLMRVPSLTTEKYAKIARQVKKSSNPFQKIAIKSNREGWVMKK